MHDEQEGQHFNACSQHTETGVGGSAGAQTPPGGRAQTLHFQRREDLTGGLLSGTSDKSARTPVSVSSPRGQPTPFRLQTPSKTGARRRACACRAPSALVGRASRLSTLASSTQRQQPTKPNSGLQTTTWGTVCHTQGHDGRSNPCPRWDLPSEMPGENLILGTRRQQVSVRPECPSSIR